MNRHRIVLSAFTLAVLSACSASPPKVSCLNHLTPINVSITVAPKAGAAGAGGAPAATSGKPLGKDAPHGP
jgi:predicted component of type VI protein secretion system